MTDDFPTQEEVDKFMTSINMSKQPHYAPDTISLKPIDQYMKDCYNVPDKPNPPIGQVVSNDLLATSLSVPSSQDSIKNLRQIYKHEIKTIDLKREQTLKKIFALQALCEHPRRQPTRAPLHYKAFCPDCEAMIME